ncbi:putative glutamate--cysteine ligase 2 [Mycobacterium saskatchewanense]|nr:putative glutamate--cysteine ligase 2 [Mycobacterium saskatchewanense]
MSDLPTFGAEEEFLLVHPRTGEPAPRNAAVAAEGERLGIELQVELSSCQVETTSSVMSTSAELQEELARLRRVSAQAAEAAGVTLLASGLPPATPHEFPVTDTPRYRRIGEQYGMVAHEQGICGCHVHVQVPDRPPPSTSATGCGRGCRRCSRCRPIRRCIATPRAATRAGAACCGGAGLPPGAAVLPSPDDYDRAVRMLVDTGVILDPKMIYWDVRPSANFPTVEVRVADVPATVAETVLIATLIRAAVMTALDAPDEGDQLGRLPPGALRAAYWKAAHDGLSGDALDLIRGRGAVPAREQLGALVSRVRPALEVLGEYDRVTGELDRIAADGNGAIRQLRAWRKRGKVMDVVEQLRVATLG